MPFDYKKEYKEFYLPPAKPVIVNVPKANYIAVRGKGDPNDEGGAYHSPSRTSSKPFPIMSIFINK